MDEISSEDWVQIFGTNYGGPVRQLDQATVTYLDIGLGQELIVPRAIVSVVPDVPSRLVGLTPEVSEYRTCAVPSNHELADLFTVTIEARRVSLRLRRWEVRRHKKSLAADGTWNTGPHDGDDWDWWTGRYWHDFKTAVVLAAQAVNTLTVAGRTAAQWLAEEGRA